MRDSEQTRLSINNDVITECPRIPEKSNRFHPSSPAPPRGVWPDCLDRRPRRQEIVSERFTKRSGRVLARDAPCADAMEALGGDGPWAAD